MNNTYRIIKASHGEYAVEFKRWWWPFCWSKTSAHTYHSISMAERAISSHSREVVAIYKPKTPKQIEDERIEHEAGQYFERIGVE